MTNEVLKRATEPFFTTKSGRSGIGLTVAHGIWRRHRGALSIESQPGEGTVIRLAVEAHATAMVPEPIPRPEPAPPASPPAAPASGPVSPPPPATTDAPTPPPSDPSTPDHG